MGKAATASGTLSGVAKRIRLFHWKPEEAAAIVELLSNAGYQVYYPGPREASPYSKIRALAPVAVVIDLSRMPSHGRYVAAEIRSYKGIRQIPIVFVDGEGEALERTKKMLPDATYTTRPKLVATLRKVKPVENPVTPPPMGNDRTTAQKMGIREGMRVGLLDAPAGYTKILGPMPESVELVEEPEDTLPVTLWWVTDSEIYLAGVRAMRKLAAKTRLWIVYPKGGKTQLTQYTVRDAALAVGLVDYKICSVDATWTAMAFTIKK